MMPNSELLAKLSSDVRVLIWASNKPLSFETPHFETIDYLLDGLVRRHLATSGEWQNVTFVHTLYGANFWLAFTDGSGSADDFLEGLLGIIPEDARGKMLILNPTQLAPGWDNKLDKAFGFVERI